MAPPTIVRAASLLLVAVTTTIACRNTGSRPPESAPDAGETSPVQAPAAARVPWFETGDLAALKRRGVLRAIVESTDEASLPSGGSTRAAERDHVVEFGRRHGLQVQFVLAPSFSQLFPMLLEGMGDVILADLAVTPERSKLVSFTRPVAVVSELVVGRRGAPNPRRLEELKGRAVHVRAGSSFAQSLAALNVTRKLGAVVVTAPDESDPEELVADVAEGRRPLTVVDSHVFSDLQRTEERVEQLFPIAEARQIAWAVRPANPELKAALDQYLVEKALTQHADEASTGDLDEIRRRGALRVLTCNSPVTYYLHRGQRYGFDFELARLAAKALGVRLEMIVAPNREALVPWLLEGRGDVIAASFGVSEERAKRVSFSAPYLHYAEVVVQRTAGPKLSSLAELKGKRIAVRPGSSTHELVAALLPTHGPFEIVPIPADEEIEATVERVAKGEVPFAVLGSHALQVELSFRDDVEAGPTLPGAGEGSVAFAVRPGNPALLAGLDAFVKQAYRGLEYNVARRRYFENRSSMTTARHAVADAGQGRLSPYDPIIRRYSREYGLDWRLMAAQAYQESRFDPAAKSWVGAVGLFQVMPTTGKSLGFTRLESPDDGTHAGIKYMHHLLRTIDPAIPLKHRLRFALAAYNVGLGHVLDAQRLATRLGLDPHKWFGHVEKAMLLLEQPRYFRQARHGYCRGREPVQYVSRIQNRYDDYVKLVPL